MGIEINSIKVTDIHVVRSDEGGNFSITGKYELVSSKGIVVAKQGFNGYSEKSFSFDTSIGRNLFSDIESAIEIEIGIQEAVKGVK